MALFDMLLEKFISICNLQLDQGIECGCKGWAIFGKKIYLSQKSLSTMFLFFALLSSASLAAAELAVVGHSAPFLVLPFEHG